MVVITLSGDRELAVFKDYEIIAPRNQAIRRMLEILTEANYFK